MDIGVILLGNALITIGRFIIGVLTMNIVNAMLCLLVHPLVVCSYKLSFPLYWLKMDRLSVSRLITRSLPKNGKISLMKWT